MLTGISSGDEPEQAKLLVAEVPLLTTGPQKKLHKSDGRRFRRLADIPWAASEIFGDADITPGGLLLEEGAEGHHEQASHFPNGRHT